MKPNRRSASWSGSAEWISRPSCGNWPDDTNLNAIGYELLAEAARPALAQWLKDGGAGREAATPTTATTAVAPVR